jgi:hypothetical protein
MPIKSKKLVSKHPQLILSEDKKVISHVQRDDGEWIQNTVMIEGCDVPFKYRRKRKYKNLKGSLVNLSYYPETKIVAGLEFETMKVVKISRA